MVVTAAVEAVMARPSRAVMVAAATDTAAAVAAVVVTAADAAAVATGTVVAVDAGARGQVDVVELARVRVGDAVKGGPVCMRGWKPRDALPSRGWRRPRGRNEQECSPQEHAAVPWQIGK